MILVQITDPHLSVEAGELWGGYEPDFAFAAVLEAVARLVPQPDLVLFTGDLTETGAPAEYANFLRLAGALPLRKAAIRGTTTATRPSPPRSPTPMWRSAPCPGSISSSTTCRSG